jgi:hypothetical protein
VSVPWSHHKSGGWASQFRRMLRWHANLQEVRRARSAEPTMEHECDTVYIFFQNAFHLRDWILEDHPGLESDIRALFEKSRDLQLCRDICNGTKHYRLKYPSVDGDIAIGPEYVPADAPGERPHINETWFVLAAGQRTDVFDLADRCVERWKEFLRKHSLDAA